MDSPSPGPPKPPPSPASKPGDNGRTASKDTTASRTPTAATAPIPDEDHGSDLPLTMSASVVLTGLPRDAHEALADVEAIDKGKGMGYYFIFYVFSLFLSHRSYCFLPVFSSSFNNRKLRIPLHFWPCFGVERNTASIPHLCSSWPIFMGA